MYLLCYPQIWSPESTHIDREGPHTGYFLYFSDNHTIMGTGIWYGYRSSVLGAIFANNIGRAVPMMDINYLVDNYIVGAGKDMYHEIL